MWNLFKKWVKRKEEGKERSPFLLASLPGDVSSPTEAAHLSIFCTTEAGRVLAFVRCVSAQHLNMLWVKVEWKDALSSVLDISVIHILYLLIVHFLEDLGNPGACICLPRHHSSWFGCRSLYLALCCQIGLYSEYWWPSQQILLPWLLLNIIFFPFGPLMLCVWTIYGT